MSKLIRFFTRRRKKNEPKYNINDDLYQSKSNSSRSKTTDIECKIIILDGTEATFFMPKKSSASKVYENVFQQLEFTQEQDYFALQYTDTRNINHWLDPTKQIRKQCEIGPPYTLKFRVKFYSSDPHSLKDELTRYFFVLQLKDDIRSGQLQCDEEIGAELAALCLQGEFGDYVDDEHSPAFVSAFRFLPDDQQTEEFELLVLEKYRELKDHCILPSVADKIYLEKVRLLADYGVDNHMVTGKDSAEYSLGLTPTGILIYEGTTKIGLFYWPNILKLAFRKHRLKVVVGETEEGTEEVNEHKFVFSLPDTRACKHLWKCAVEHHTFFRLTDPQKPPSKRRQLFRLRSRFHSSFRTEYQLQRMNSFGTSTRRTGKFERTPSRRFSARASFEKADLETRKAVRDKIREEKKTVTLERIQREESSVADWEKGEHTVAEVDRGDSGQRLAPIQVKAELNSQVSPSQSLNLSPSLNGNATVHNAQSTSTGGSGRTMPLGETLNSSQTKTPLAPGLPNVPKITVQPAWPLSVTTSGQPKKTAITPESGPLAIEMEKESDKKSPEVDAKQDTNIHLERYRQANDNGFKSTWEKSDIIQAPRPPQRQAAPQRNIPSSMPTNCHAPRRGPPKSHNPAAFSTTEPSNRYPRQTSKSPLASPANANSPWSPPAVFGVSTEI